MGESSESADSPTDTSLPRNVKAVGLASLLNDAASEMIYPLLPHFLLNVLLGNRFHLGVIEGIADSVASFVKLWSGDQSDQAGRRKGFIIFGYSIPAVVRPLTGLVMAPWQLFAIRVVDRIGKGIRSSPRDSLIADSTHHSLRGRAFGFQRGMDNFGAAIGPLLAAAFLWLWPNKLRTLFFVALLPGLTVAVMLIFGLREKPVPTPPGEKWRLTLKPFSRSFKLYLVALAVFMLGNSSDAFLLVRASEVGIAPVMVPLLWCVCHVAKSASNLILGHAVDRFGSRPALLLGWLVFAGVYIGLGLATSTAAIWTCFIVYGLISGLIEPAERALVATLAGSERKGLAYGWFNFAVGVATLPSSLIFGALYQGYGPLVAFIWGAALALFAVILLMAVSEKAPPES